MTWKEKTIKKIEQALAIEGDCSAYDSVKISIVVDLKTEKSIIDIGKRADDKYKD